ncbi:type I-U CRISPR-associated protein Csb2, partial [Streptomyces xiamenensis]|uniref:type I-G CRISPR-associated protein Csb2 n=1 Tax=Streptomyces xiamenensis TaxID=408015 RepID=UPI0035DCD48B
KNTKSSDDDTETTKGSAEGYGSIPFHRIEYTARTITADFTIDTQLLRSYNLPDPTTELLTALALWEIRVFPRDVHLRITAHGPAEKVLPTQLTTPSTHWASLTPFIPPRHRKKNQDPTTYLTDAITRELNNRNLPQPADIKITPGPWALHTRHRYRKGETLKNSPTAYGIHLTFHQPTPGPITLGRHAHFGLGTFYPTTSEPQAHTENPHRTEAKCP